MLGISEEMKGNILLQKARENIHILENLLPVISFIIPFLILYYLYPNTFQITYQGRTFFLFFLWLASLEIILNWGKTSNNRICELKTARKVFYITSLALPAIYVVVANYFGLNDIIIEAAKLGNVPLADLVPLSIEYIVFAVLFTLIILLGNRRIMNFSISTFFLMSIGIIYAIDDLYPYGRFTPFQILVPATVTLAANVLDLMGYQTSIQFMNDPYYGSMPMLSALDPNEGNFASFSIAWPCAGVESLIIYTITILLFLKKTSVPWKQGIVYLVVGAVITYVINILRIVTVFVISIKGGDVWAFHNYYGWLYSLTWIVSYPLIIIGSRILWRKIRNWETKHDVSDLSKTKVK